MHSENRLAPPVSTIALAAHDAITASEGLDRYKTIRRQDRRAGTKALAGPGRLATFLFSGQPGFPPLNKRPPVRVGLLLRLRFRALGSDLRRRRPLALLLQITQFFPGGFAIGIELADNQKLPLRLLFQLFLLAP